MAGVWAARVVPRITNAVLATKSHHEVRERVCSGLSGRVVELGFGSGLNVTHYPPAVERVSAVEPSELAWQLASRRVAASPAPVERAGLDGQQLPFDDDSFDSALSTWTLCTIPDAGAALREVVRVLRPGGRLFFVEHGAAPDRSVRRWQDRLDPLQQRVFAGCHLNRDVTALLTGAALAPQQLETYYVKGGPRPFTFLYEGYSVPVAR